MALVQECHLKTTDIAHIQNKSLLHSVMTQKQRAQKLLISNLPIVIEKCSNDKSGTLCYFYTSIQGKKIAFVSMYAPEVFDVHFFPWLTNQLLLLNEYALIIGGDMNALADLIFDK